MKSCERFEAAVSAWLDEELARADQVELVDHLARCGACRGFYVEARALDGALAVLRPPRDARVPGPELWQRIERTAKARPTRTVPVWALRAAAMLVLAIGVAGLLWSTGHGTSRAPADALIALGEDAGRMTDARFLELATEVLRAEPRYRSAMYRVMHQVIEDTTTGETTADAEFAGASRKEVQVNEIVGREPV